MNHRLDHLRVKLKTLAAESRIIRKEEQKAKRRARNSSVPEMRAAYYQAYRHFRDHRRGVVRRAARHTLLALGFLRGKTYAELEPYSEKEPSWSHVHGNAVRFSVPEWKARMTKNFEDEETRKKWEAWLGKAKEHFRTSSPPKSQPQGPQTPDSTPDRPSSQRQAESLPA